MTLIMSGSSTTAPGQHPQVLKFLDSPLLITYSPILLLFSLLTRIYKGSQINNYKNTCTTFFFLVYPNGNEEASNTGASHQAQPGSVRNEEKRIWHGQVEWIWRKS